ncbi:competence protein CoiA [Bacillus sp. S/N-304-OC-R1]|uniref:competence protein CoiA n=1 Tax=Bacillus sp. S/N-304-OC-R1 TaxID=2758034 RepID=UPI001C8DD0D7|nr:competence protein CoiA family protein [Bacillus sp. S/N-304-OC-R1]MBY0121014.1 hypothetical protein [Bacillus sp. S/N-304-OC-R1]
MLISKTKHGEWISLASNRNLQKLKELRKLESFYCPECEEPVILKAGTKKIPHFAHLRGSACTESFERESEYHLKGKFALFTWLKSHGLSPALEPYLKTIAQRPDISFNYKGIQYAIEYQCSTIPQELFQKRTENYFKENISPIWIMAGKNVKRKNNNVITLSKFDYLFLAETPSNTLYIPAYCPITNSLITIQHILPISVKNTLSNLSVKSLNSAGVMDLIHPNNVRPYFLRNWIYETKKTKNITIPLYGSIHNKFLQELYSHGIIPSLLPHEIGLPVPSIHYIETPAIEWQSYIYIDILKSGATITVENIIHSFQRRVRNQDIRLRSLPLLPNNDGLIAVKEYINLLIKINVLQPIEETKLKVNHSYLKLDNIQNYLESEQAFYNKYERIISESLR